ncbi:MAG: terminase gpA endonuclease subunit, partial [Verrucomicrobiota bacterium]
DVSFTWNALLPWWVSWKGIVKEYLLAIEAARNGNIEPMRTFVTETLAESWEDRLGVIEDFGFLEARKANYEYGEVWPEEVIRFMAADKQERGGEHYWWVIRAFGPNGKSRLIAHGNAKTKAELETIRKQYGAVAANSMIDSGYMAQDVYRFCGATGWKCFKGDSGDFYTVPVQDPKNPTRFVTVRRIWRKTKAVVYNSQTKRRIGDIPLFTFCGAPTKDLLLEYMTGLVGDWTLPRITAKEYMRQLTGERREEHRDPKGVISFFWKRVSDNHYFDCEQMILIAAIITKTINAPSTGSRHENN